jgi:hypothetical protein
MIKRVSCRICNSVSEIEMTEEQNRDIMDGRKLIQNILPFPMYSAAVRELFVSGFCGTCWDNMFSEDEEDEQDYEDDELSDRYLTHLMSDEEKKAFELRMSTDPQLTEAVEFKRLVIKAIRKDQLMQSIGRMMKSKEDNDDDEELSDDPEDMLLSGGCPDLEGTFFPNRAPKMSDDAVANMILDTPNDPW